MAISFIRLLWHPFLVSVALCIASTLGAEFAKVYNTDIRVYLALSSFFGPSVYRAQQEGTKRRLVSG